jgi:hypothetical protein
VPGHRAERLLVFLRQRSLLQLRGSPERYEVGLHDLHRAYTQRDEQEVAALAEALLESYQPSEPDAWWSVPDDGYVRGHLVRHLLRSRPVREVQSLLAAEDDEQRNRWYRARLLDAHDGTPDLPDGFAGYVADVQLASDRVPGCLLPLVTASLCSLTRAVPGQLLRTAVTDTRWSLDRGITHARLPAAPEDRARAMVALLPRVEDRRSWLEETLDAIEATDVFTRGELIEELAPVASPSDVLPILRRIVTWIGRASTPFEQAHTKPLVHPVLARVPASQAAAAVEIVEGIGIKAVRLYGALPEPERSARSWSALEDARAHQGDLGISLHAGTVSELAEHLDPVSATPLLAGALAAVRGIEDGNVLRQEALFDLLPHLPAEDQRGVLHELIENAHEEPRLFRRLAAAAPPALHPRIREALEAHDLVWMADAAPAFSGPDREALVDRVLSEAERDLDAVWLLSKDDAAGAGGGTRPGRRRHAAQSGRARTRAPGHRAAARASPARRRTGRRPADRRAVGSRARPPAVAIPLRARRGAGARALRRLRGCGPVRDLVRRPAVDAP